MTDDKLHVVRLRPGTSSEKSLKVILNEDMQNATIADVIRHGLEGQNLGRGDTRIAERLRAEIQHSYGITIRKDGETVPVQAGELISAYFAPMSTNDGMDYMEADLIISARQEGGLVAYQ